jgi:hypothetical protein
LRQGRIIWSECYPRSASRLVLDHPPGAQDQLLHPGKVCSERTVIADRACFGDCRELSHQLKDKVVALLDLVRGEFQKKFQIIDYLANHCLSPATMLASLDTKPFELRI